MERQNAHTAKPLPITEAKELLAQMVRDGETAPERAALIDLRELTEGEKAHGMSLGGLARRALDRNPSQAV